MLGHGDGGPGVSALGGPVGLAGRGREARILRPVLQWLRVGAIAFAWVLIGVGQRPVGPELLLAVTAGLLAFATWRLLARPASGTGCAPDWWPSRWSPWPPCC